MRRNILQGSVTFLQTLEVQGPSKLTTTEEHETLSAAENTERKGRVPKKPRIAPKETTLAYKVIIKVTMLNFQ